MLERSLREKKLKQFSRSGGKTSKMDGHLDKLF